MTSPDSQALIDAMSTGLVWLGPDLRVRALNPAAAELLSLPQHPSPGVTLADLMPRAEAWLARLATAAQDGQGYQQRELSLPTADGQRQVTVDCTITPLLEGEAPWSLLVELQPLDRHLAIAREEALLSQQATWRQLTRALAHEVKNPLGGLRGAAQLLERELPDPALAEYTRVIIREADRLRDLVDALLGPARREARSTHNVHALIEHVLRVVGTDLGSHITIRRDYDPSLPELELAGDQVIQALLNLVRNAQQALDGRRGHITLRTRAERRFTIGTRVHRLAVRIEVEDDGPGVPADLADRLFFPLVSGRADGSGLGLGIAQDLVQRHGGVIEWHSEPGRTLFSIVLPVLVQET